MIQTMFSSLKSVLRKSFTPLNLITISKKRLLENFYSLEKMNPKVKIAPVLKSNAYGHGINLVGEIMDKVNAPFLCVDSLYEAFQLQKSDIKTPILIMGYIHPDSLKVKKLPFNFAVYDLEHAKALNKYQKQASVHIFIDTGMNREGVSMDKLEEFVKELKKLKDLKVEGLMSHLASSQKKDSPENKEQTKNFKIAKELFSKNGFKIKWFHIGATYGLLNDLTEGCNLVRVGKALYGVTADRENFLKPVLKLTTKIVQIKEIKAGDQVGYDGTFIAKKKMKIGILPLGYNDGFDRRLSNKGVVLVDGIECKILGLISMNVSTIDLSNIKNLPAGRQGPFVGQEVVIFSDNPDDKNSVINVTKICNTITYDILARLEESTKRVVI